MYKKSNTYPFILTVKFCRHYKVFRKKAILPFCVTIKFKENMNPALIWKGKCYITKDNKVKWKFEKSCPYYIAILAEKQYSKSEILEKFYDMEMLAFL